MTTNLQAELDAAIEDIPERVTPANSLSFLVEHHAIVRQALQYMRDNPPKDQSHE